MKQKQALEIIYALLKNSHQFTILSFRDKIKTYKSMSATEIKEGVHKHD